MKKYLNKLLIGVALLGALLCAMPDQVYAQKSMLSSYGLTSDTVTNTATGYLQAEMKGNFAEVDIQVNATEISGTTAGTISILGSLDGVNYKALTVRDATTAIPTFTATDVATQTNIWRITGNAALFYRVSWTGAGTMSDRFTAKIIGR